MDDKTFINLAKNATKIINNSKFRLKDRKKNPGGLLEIPKSLSPIIIGDLHGARSNLEKILNHNDNLSGIKKNKNILVIIGDALHNDQTGQMLEMQSSLDTIELVFELINDYPNNVVYIRGNHDTFDERLRKSGIAQGLEFKKLLIKTRGEDAADEMENFFEALPMFIIGEGYVITHGGPIRGGSTKEELINIKDDENKYMQLMWNRIHEFRGNPSLKEYGGDDIKKTLEKLNLSLDTHFIVGHNPMWSYGDANGVWLNVLGIKKHHIIYTNLQTLAPYLVIENNEVLARFAKEPKEEVYFV
jgi:predicted phosphodiesterase